MEVGIVKISGGGEGKAGGHATPSLPMERRVGCFAGNGLLTDSNDIFSYVPAEWKLLQDMQPHLTPSPE